MNHRVFGGVNLGNYFIGLIFSAIILVTVFFWALLRQEGYHSCDESGAPIAGA